MEKGNLADSFANENISYEKQTSILELLRIRPVIYEVCKWEIDPITKKPIKICWIEEPVNALVLS